MPFQIHALPAEDFAPLFALDDDALTARRAQRVTVAETPGYPCRISLADAEVGETIILLNHCCHDADTPYRATHAIFVRPGVATARPAPDEVPEALARRLLSLRAFDAKGMMRTADVVDGGDLGPALDAMLAAPEIAEVAIHHAKQGCYAARATRV